MEIEIIKRKFLVFQIYAKNTKKSVKNFFIRKKASYFQKKVPEVP